MKCPRDFTELKRGVKGNIVFKSCPECGGLWIGHESLQAFFGIRPPLENSTVESGRPVVQEIHEATVRCPEEATHFMRRFEYDGVTLDICESHQCVWLDGVEVYAIAEGVRSRQQTRAKPAGRVEYRPHFGERVANAFDGFGSDRSAHRTSPGEEWAAVHLEIVAGIIEAIID